METKRCDCDCAVQLEQEREKTREFEAWLYRNVIQKDNAINGEDIYISILVVYDGSPVDLANVLYEHAPPEDRSPIVSADLRYHMMHDNKRRTTFSLYICPKDEIKFDSLPPFKPDCYYSFEKSFGRNQVMVAYRTVVPELRNDYLTSLFEKVSQLGIDQEAKRIRLAWVRDATKATDDTPLPD